MRARRKRKIVRNRMLLSKSLTIREEHLESQLRKEKESYTNARLERIKEQERELLDTRS